MFQSIANRISILGENRRKTGITIGIAGLSINIFISGIEFFSGMITGSITLMADSFHNGVDALLSVFTVFTFSMTEKAADKKHPFGFGRIEYLCSFLVALIIMGIGLLFVKSSFERVLHPSPVQFSFIAILLMLIAIPLKLFYCVLNRKMGERINSLTLNAVSFDALSDVLILAVTALSLLIAKTTGLQIDGYFGILVSAFIIYSGYSITQKAVASLIGKAPDQTIVDAISSAVLKVNHVVGFHDLIVHDYGPGRVTASVHAEIPSHVPLIKAHEAICQAITSMKNEGIGLVVHIDPITFCQNRDCSNRHHYHRGNRWDAQAGG